MSTLNVCGPPRENQKCLSSLQTETGAKGVLSAAPDQGPQLMPAPPRTLCHAGDDVCMRWMYALTGQDSASRKIYKLGSNREECSGGSLREATSRILSKKMGSHGALRKKLPFERRKRGCGHVTESWHAGCEEQGTGGGGDLGEGKAKPNLSKHLKKQGAYCVCLLVCFYFLLFWEAWHPAPKS